MESFVPSEDLLFRLSECGNESSGLQKTRSPRRRRGTVIGRMKKTIGLGASVDTDIVRRVPMGTMLGCGMPDLTRWQVSGQLGTFCCRVDDS